MPNIRRAEMRARAVLAKYKIEGPVVDVAQLAKSEGIEIDVSDFGDEVSGVLVKDGDRAVIGVNGRHPITRQRFTIAHELGHHLLHGERNLYVDKSYVVHFRDENSSTGYDPLEVEANHFAAELLMPADKVRQFFVKHPFDIDDETALRRLATTFGVSSTAMLVRLSSLGLIVAS